MTRAPNSARSWGRRGLLTSVAGLAVAAGLGACATETSAIGLSGVGADDDDAPPPAAGLLAFRSARNFGSAAPAGATYSIFHAFARGTVPVGDVARISARGVPVERQQCDNRVAWPDGSLRCGVFTWSHPHAIGGGGRDQITIHAVPGTWNNAPSGALNALLAHDYRMEVVIGGVTYSLSANNEIREARRITRIRGGNACTAWKIWGDFRVGTSPASPIQGQMWGKMFLYLTPDGHVRIEDEIYCNKIANSAAIPITSYALLDGGTVLFKNTTPFTLYTRNKIATYDEEGRAYFSGPDVSKVVWAFPRPVLRNRATTGLYDAMITWWNKWTPTYIAAFPEPLNVAYAPNSFGNIFGGIAVGINGTGNHTFLGPMTSLAVMAMLNGRYDFQRQDRKMALGSWGMCVFWCADDATGLPPVLTRGTYAGLSAPIVNVGWGLRPTVRMEGGNNRGAAFDGSHAGLWWWWQYLATGSEQALENIMEQGVGILGCSVAGSEPYQRNPTYHGKKYYGSYAGFPMARSLAWELRNLSNAYWVTPDRHAMKAYLNDLVQVQYDSVADLLAEHAAEWGALGVYNTRDFAPSGYIPLLSPWMHDYLATSVTMDVRRGRIPPSHPIVASHLIKWTYGRMVDGNFFNATGPYRISPGKGPNALSGAPYAQVWTDVYGFSAPPDMIHPLVDNPPVMRGLRNANYRGSQADPAPAYPPDQNYVGHTYPNLALCAGHCGVAAGLGKYPEKVVAYLDPIVDNAHGTEALWGRSSGTQAWRLRVPA